MGFRAIGALAARSMVIFIQLAVFSLTGSYCRAADGPPDPQIAEIQKLTDKASDLQKSGKLDEALGVWKRRLSLVRSIVLNENTESVAGSIELLAYVYELKGDFTNAIRFRSDALEIRKVLNGESHWKTADARQTVNRDERLAKFNPAQRERRDWCDAEADACFRLAEQGKFVDAGKRYQPVIAEQTRLWGANTPAIAQSLYNCAAFAQRSGDFEQSRKWFAESLEIRTRSLGDFHPDTARSQLGLANTCFTMGDAKTASTCIRRAMDGFLQSLGEDSPETLAAIKATASFLMQQDLPQSELLYRRVLEIERRTVPTNKQRIGVALEELSGVQASLGDFSGAIQSLEEAFGLLNESEALISTRGLQVINSLSSYFHFTGNVQRAEKIDQIGNTIRTALASREPSSVEDFDATIKVERDIARIDGQRGEFAVASKHLERALLLLDKRRKLDRSATSEWHFRFIRSQILFSLGVCSSRLGQFLSARKSLEESNLLQNNDFGAARAMALRELGFVSVAEKRMDDAVDELDRARKEQFDQCWKLLWTMSEREQLFRLQLDRETELDRTLGICFVDPTNPRLVGRGFEWHLNGTMLSTEVLSARTSIDRISEKGRQEIAELRRVHSQGGQFALPAGTVASVDAGKQDANLQRREEALSRSLNGRELPHLVARWVTLEEVTQSLPEGVALIEFARINASRQTGAFDVHVNTNINPRYAAWIVRGGKSPEVNFVALGDVLAIDSAVGKLTLQIASFGKRVSLGKVDGTDELEAEAVTRSALEAVSKMVLEPVEKHLGGIKHLVLSPDGALSLLPWNALISQDGSYLIERYGLRTVGSGRDLVRRKNNASEARDLVLIADPDFDAEFAAGKPADGATGATATRRKWARLPGAADEAVLILPFVKKYGGSDPMIYKGKQATKSTMMGLRNPQVLVLITHGYYESVPNSVTSYFRRQLIDSTTGIGPADDPLMRCGIVLAGANLDKEALEQSKTILTGRDVLRLQLNGTRLVVLSACETAAGEIRQGEGLAGLTQAFRIAGADNVLSAQWSIPDDETTELMSLFWAEAAGRMSLGMSLRNAQLRWIKTHRKKADGAAHPYYWAAFMLHGTAE